MNLDDGVHLQELLHLTIIFPTVCVDGDDIIEVRTGIVFFLTYSVDTKFSMSKTDMKQI